MKKLVLALLLVMTFVFVGCVKDSVTYTVEFDSQGGTEVAAQTVKENEKALKPANPEKEGYTFIGWFNGEEEFDFEMVITKDITLTAKWDKIVSTYTVTFNSDGGSIVANQTVKENEKPVRPDDPEKEGYTFLGWFAGDAEYDFNSVVTANITLTAKWEKQEPIVPPTLRTYTVTFNSDGGTVVSNQEVNEFEKANKPVNPTKEGYTFIGWFNGDVEYDFDSAVTTNITLTAHWEKVIVTYTVTFNSDGGTIVANQTVNENEKVNKPTNPTKDGYTFIGWFNGEVEYDFDGEVIGNITLTAKWEEIIIPVTYTVTFNSDGGTVVANQTINENEKAIKPVDPTKEGYIFKGWFNGDTEFDFNTVVTTNITLTAKWEEETPEPLPVVYTVTFNSDGGTIIANQTINENEKAVKPADPTKDGYTFIGWFKGEVEYDFDTVVTSNITLTAKWEEIIIPVTYTVTFNSDGGTIVANQTINENEKAVKPADPTKEGYIFKGWYNGDSEFDFNTVITENITLTAKWEKKTGSSTGWLPGV